MEALKAVEVSRRYGKQEVLKDFSLSVEAGSFEALMGPSGSGKSTFLHIAAGLLAADAGSVEIGGKDVVKMSDSEATKFRRRHVGVVFQAFNLLNEKTVRENILLPLALDGALGRKTKDGRLEELAKRLGIAALLEKSPRSCPAASSSASPSRGRSSPSRRSSLRTNRRAISTRRVRRASARF